MNDAIMPQARFEPYWWAAAAPQRLAAGAPATRYDVAVIGAGFTGMRAALELARAGRSVVVLDKEPAGSGAARRNAGYLGRVLKKSLPTLMAKHGEAKGIALYRELGEAFAGTIDFIARENIDCRLTRHGRYIAATSTAHYDAMAAELESMRRHLGYPYEMVPASAQRREFGSDAYRGGAVIPDLAAIHPGLYHRGLTQRAVAAGAVICDDVAVRAVQPEGGGVSIATDRGTIAARDAIIATNGYTPRSLAWLARRVVPFQAYMAATETLSDAQLDEAIPQRRTVLDSNTNIDFFRPAPDSPRLLFGGGTGVPRGGFREIARFLHGLLGRVLPQLKEVRLEWVWTGFCAGTFDLMPHIGGRERIWYGLGYNFAGVPMGTHFGAKLAALVMDRPEGRSAFAAAPFPTLPLYTGKPWFVPLAMRYFDWKDGKRG
ncbi:MAG TPA: FAD-binding oxidoreductase [Dongiaceae bacterium]|nr:FAD-binding oxidoreductase [Dongiaceae bacterium]